MKSRFQAEHLSSIFDYVDTYCFFEFLGEELGIFKEKGIAIDFRESTLSNDQIYNDILGMLRRKQAIPACQYCRKVYREKLGRVPVAEQID